MEEDKSNKFDDLLKQYKFPLAAGVVGLVLLVGGVISSGIIPKTFIKSSSSLSASSPKSSTPQTSLVKVDVSGAVVSPGVYGIKSDARLEDALRAAGGASSSADPVYLTQTLNLAQKVVDGMKIYIPFAGEKGSSLGISSSSSSNSNSSTINVNTASLSDLDKLPGVGVVTAQKIIDGRPYQGIEELVTKKAIYQSVFDKIKDKVSVY